jgi:pyrimidine operon attenuation protein/uracil phosphoribosyltransferase
LTIIFNGFTIKRMNKIKVMDKENLQRCVKRLSYEILEKNKGAENLVLVGIRTRGVPLAQRIKENIYKIEKQDVVIGTLDITLYRDDLEGKIFSPEVKQTEIPVDVTDKVIVLVDEVIFTGRTIRCALDALMDLGRPAKVQLAVLIDRGHRELPIKPDFVGKNIPTSVYEEIKVSLKEVDDKDCVEIVSLKKPYRK